MQITGVSLGEPIPITNSHGDLWTNTWGGDDIVYTVSDDSRGFNDACESNLAVHKLTGRPPHISGATINPMVDYGAKDELREDGAGWKANGIACIDDVLYLSVSRHYYMEEPFWVQEAWDSSIVKSEDYGQTWTAAPTLGHSMFPGHAFGAPFFVQYGKNGAGDAHSAATFVYAISASGAWNNGSRMILGRVRRDRIGRLDPEDWEFIHTFEEAKAGNPIVAFDEGWAPVWKSRHDVARPVFLAPGETSMTGAQYIEPLDLYVMVQWSFPHLAERPHPARWQCTRWDFYQARTPWGPWLLFGSKTFEPEAFYNPCVVSKFVSEDGRDLWITTAGEPFVKEYYHLHYRLHLIPARLEIHD